MIKSQEVADLNSCLNKSKPDEPLFVLCARDSLAPKAVRNWAAALIQASQHQRTAEAQQKMVDKAAAAMEEAGKMEAWQLRYHHKLPD